MSRGDARWLSRTRVSGLAGSCSRQLTHEHVYLYNQSWTFWGILRRRRAGSSRTAYPVPKAVSLIRNLPGRYSTGTPRSSSTLPARWDSRSSQRASAFSFVRNLDRANAGRNIHARSCVYTLQVYGTSQQGQVVYGVPRIPSHSVK